MIVAFQIANYFTFQLSEIIFILLKLICPVLFFLFSFLSFFYCWELLGNSLGFAREVAWDKLVSIIIFHRKYGKF